MIQLLINLVILGVISGLGIWVVRYFQSPEIVDKIIVVLTVVCAIVMVLQAFGYSTGLHVQ